MLRKKLQPKEEKVTKRYENFIMASFTICTPCQISVGLSHERRASGSYTAEDIFIDVFDRSLKERDNLEDMGVDESIIIKWNSET
jgi:hypothetical protein